MGRAKVATVLGEVPHVECIVDDDRKYVGQEFWWKTVDR